MKQRPYHVLVAEDHPLTRHEIMSVLQLRDYSVLSVASPIEVAQTLKRWPVDLLITGTRMGSWYGLQVMLTGRATQPELGAIIVSDGAGQMTNRSTRDAITSRSFAAHSPDEFLALVAERLASIQRRQRWPRKPVTSAVPMSISGQPGQLLDVSYGGCRVRLPGGPVLGAGRADVAGGSANRSRRRVDLVGDYAGRLGVHRRCLGRAGPRADRPLAQVRGPRALTEACQMQMRRCQSDIDTVIQHPSSHSFEALVHRVPVDAFHHAAM